jgi:MoaA/NifB/PqqE/SkfB family radical SAM enzyme
MCSCSRICDAEKEKGRMDASEYRKLAAELDMLGCLSANITGGEPLIRRDIEEIITALNPRNKIVNLITNGICLDKERLRRYRRLGIDSVVVSLESASADENDRIRGYSGHFSAVKNIIGWAREEGVNLGISLTLGDFNFEKVYEMLEFSLKNSLFFCIAHGGSTGNWSGNEKIFLSEPNARKVLSLIKRHKRMKIDFSANLSLRPGCPAMTEKAYITPYADVLPCAFNPIAFGNLRSEPFRVIWERMAAFRRQNAPGDSLCLRTYNKAYIEKFLSPLAGARHPVSLQQHPYFLDKEKI